VWDMGPLQMKCFVGVTDGAWYRFLSHRPDLDEVNFWQPSGRPLFKALSRGDPFLFKLKYPDNAICGGGFFEHASILPCGIAWDTFGEENGASSFNRMVESITRLRHDPVTPGTNIGCIILRDPFFLPQDQWIDPPADFSPNIVRGKGYDLTRSPGKELWAEVRLRLQGLSHAGAVADGSAVYGDPVLVKQRLGQGAFRILVTDIYGRRCAVTGERALPTLEAAHLVPVSKGGQHRVDNGLLLRSDVHTLFDRGYLTVTPELRLRVSGKLKDDFDDGETYREYDHERIWVPSHVDERPSREFLEWHNDMVFLR